LKLVASVLIAAACLIAAFPAVASAENYVVNETGDAADAVVGSEGCDSVAGGASQCTLRAAIEESNLSTAVDDTITFAALFNGELADTIGVGSGFPAITDKVTIDGDGAGQCTTAAAGVLGPCVGVSKTVTGSALVVENTDGVTIEGLAITDVAGAGAAAINVLNSSASFTARDNWIGVKLDGSAGANNKGIFLDPDSNGATIGGKAAADRNVVANSGFEGLDIEGADNADVLGNYFGIKPDGATAAANAKNIEITDTVAFEATGNEVGATMEGAALASAPCDGGCNVIVGGGLSTGIDLNGEGGGNEEPATGPTTVHGNYVGLNAAGTAVLANGTFNVLVGKAEDALVGGVANGDANFIAGGGFGIFNENGEGFEAEGNIIGSGPSGADVAAPGTGVFVLNTNNANQVTVNDNVLEMDGGVGVEVRFGGTEIDGNFIRGAELGIWTKVGPGGAGPNLIEDNVIGESEANGIRIEDNENEVLSNSIYQSGAAGIRIQNPAALVNATENQIGGDTADSENNIRESGGDAIEIDNSGGEGASQNEVARNKGDENAGLFIDLIGALTNGGIQPPPFVTAQQSSASGTGALPGATVRVFRKGEAGSGEVESFLAETAADGSGNWKVSYPSIPIGTLVAATQTSVAGGTSELAIKAAAADPSGGGGGGAGGGGDDGKDKGKGKKPGKGKGKAGKDKTAPQTTILKKKIKGRAAKFRFVSSEPGSTFECKLDKKKFKPCRSPKKYKRLKPGKHVFQVRAIDAAGNRDKTPATRKFRVLPRR
jgi:Right handed beta helix region